MAPGESNAPRQERVAAERLARALLPASGPSEISPSVLYSTLHDLLHPKAGEHEGQLEKTLAAQGVEQASLLSDTVLVLAFLLNCAATGGASAQEQPDPLLPYELYAAMIEAGVTFEDPQIRMLSDYLARYNESERALSVLETIPQARWTLGDFKSAVSLAVRRRPRKFSLAEQYLRSYSNKLESCCTPTPAGGDGSFIVDSVATTTSGETQDDGNSNVRMLQQFYSQASKQAHWEDINRLYQDARSLTSHSQHHYDLDVSMVRVCLTYEQYDKAWHIYEQTPEKFDKTSSSQVDSATTVLVLPSSGPLQIITAISSAFTPSQLDRPEATVNHIQTKETIGGDLLVASPVITPVKDTNSPLVSPVSKKTEDSTNNNPMPDLTRSAGLDMYEVIIKVCRRAFFAAAPDSPSERTNWEARSWAVFSQFVAKNATSHLVSPTKGPQDLPKRHYSFSEGSRSRSNSAPSINTTQHNIPTNSNTVTANSPRVISPLHSPNAAGSTSPRTLQNTSGSSNTGPRPSLTALPFLSAAAISAQTHIIQDHLTVVASSPFPSSRANKVTQVLSIVESIDPTLLLSSRVLSTLLQFCINIIAEFHSTSSPIPSVASTPPLTNNSPSPSIFGAFNGRNNLLRKPGTFGRVLPSLTSYSTSDAQIPSSTSSPATGLVNHSIATIQHFITRSLVLYADMKATHTNCSPTAYALLLHLVSVLGVKQFVSSATSQNTIPTTLSPQDITLLSPLPQDTTPTTPTLPLLIRPTRPIDSALRLDLEQAADVCRGLDASRIDLHLSHLVECIWSVHENVIRSAPAHQRKECKWCDRRHWTAQQTQKDLDSDGVENNTTFLVPGTSDKTPSTFHEHTVASPAEDTSRFIMPDPLVLTRHASLDFSDHEAHDLLRHCIDVCIDGPGTLVAPLISSTGEKGSPSPMRNATKTSALSEQKGYSASNTGEANGSTVRSSPFFDASIRSKLRSLSMQK